MVNFTICKGVYLCFAAALSLTATSSAVLVSLRLVVLSPVALGTAGKRKA